MKQWLIFMAFMLGWSALAGQVVERGWVHPLAIFLVWIAGFLWGTAYIIDGRKTADLLVMYVGGYWIAVSALAAIVFGIGLILS